MVPQYSKITYKICHKIYINIANDHINHVNINTYTYTNTNALFHPSHLSSTRLKDLEVVGLGLVILVKAL